MKDLFKILRFMGPYKGKLALSLFLMTISSGIMLVYPKITEWAIDKGIGEKEMTIVVIAGAALLISSLLSSVILYRSVTISVSTSQNLGFDLRNSLFEKITSFSFADFDTLRVGEIMTRLNADVSSIRTFLRMGIWFFIQSIFILAGAVVLMFLTQPALAVIMAGLIALIVIIFIIFARFIPPLYSKVKKSLDRLNTILQERLGGNKLVKALSRQPEEEDKFTNANMEFKSNSVRVLTFVGILMPFLLFMGNIALLVVIWTGGGLLKNDLLTFGQLAAFNNYALMTVGPILMLITVFSNLAQVSVSSKRINEILEKKPSIPDEPGGVVIEEIQGEIIFKDVSFHYGNGENALDSIHLTIKPGEKVAVIGPTGSGKSSLAHMIPRFYDVTQGAVYIDGRDIREYNLASLRRGIVTAFQETYIFSGTMNDIITFNASPETYSQKDVEKAAAMACADEFILKKEQTWDEMITPRGTNLSGGQRQRLAIARAFFADPKILILDDVTSALDSETEKQIIENIYSDHTKRTVIIISQKISTVRCADKIVVMDEGRISAEGTHEELLKSCALYREIAETQEKHVHRGLK